FELNRLGVAVPLLRPRDTGLQLSLDRVFHSRLLQPKRVDLRVDDEDRLKLHGDAPPCRLSAATGDQPPKKRQPARPSGPGPPPGGPTPPRSRPAAPAASLATSSAGTRPIPARRTAS